LQTGALAPASPQEWANAPIQQKAGGKIDAAQAGFNGMWGLYNSGSPVWGIALEPPPTAASMIAPNIAWPVTAVPATAWTTGQFVTCANGNQVYWNGSAWVKGVAP
jgi:hypothetical protein